MAALRVCGGRGWYHPPYSSSGWAVGRLRAGQTARTAGLVAFAGLRATPRPGGCINHSAVTLAAAAISVALRKTAWALAPGRTRGWQLWFPRAIDEIRSYSPHFGDDYLQLVLLADGRFYAARQWGDDWGLRRPATDSEVVLNEEETIARLGQLLAENGLRWAE